MLPSLACLDDTAFAQADRHLVQGLGGADLLTPALMDTALRRFARQYRDPEPAALASVWSKHVLRRWFVPVLAHEIWFGRAVWTAAHLPVVLDELGLPEAIHTPPPRDGGDLEALISQGLLPFVAAVQARTGLPAKVIWSNIGNLWEALAAIAAADDSASCASHARAVLEARVLSGGFCNPLFRPIRYSRGAGGTTRLRRVCCLRHRLDGFTLCATCPKKTISVAAGHAVRARAGL